MARRRQIREAPDVGGMALRVVRALVRRAEEGDWQALEQLAMLELVTASAVGEALARMHGDLPDLPGTHEKRPRYSWAELGSVLAITRQSAQGRAAAWVREHTA